jgi:NAD(P)H-flavin reductase
MPLRHSSGKPDRAFTKKWIFESEDFREVAFIVGVARKNDLLLRDPLIAYEADNPFVS